MWRWRWLLVSLLLDVVRFVLHHCFLKRWVCDATISATVDAETSGFVEGAGCRFGLFPGGEDATVSGFEMKWRSWSIFSGGFRGARFHAVRG